MRVIFFDDNSDYTFHSIFHMFFKMAIDVDINFEKLTNQTYNLACAST